MSTDYLNAFERHYRDAELLFEHDRWPNADQLYGLAAECGLKAIMVALGMPLRDDGAPSDPKHRVHIDRLWNEYVTFVAGRGSEEFAGLGENVFADWSIHQRYHATATIGPNAVDTHRRGAEQVFRVVTKARVDGRLS